MAFYSTVYLRNIFAMDRSLKYLLSLLLKRGTHSEERTAVPSAVRGAIINALNSSNSTRMNLLTQSIAGSASGSRKKSHSGIRTKEIVSILSHFMQQEEKEGPIPGTLSREVQSPTILFHFSKKGIDKVVANILGRTSQWWDHEEGHFLSAEDKTRLNQLLPNQIRDFEKKALLYGIGMHYRVCKENQDYLEEVEYLFQSRKLKFVFATGSLSFGINMPAANVLFLGDSPYLDGLMLRQCAGRAGRRGFGESIGKVYFVGLEPSSIIQKMCLPLDQLKPQLAISTSYLLSCSILKATCHSSDSQWVHALIMSTLTQPLYKHLITSRHTQHLFDQALVHSCFFTWSFLNQRGYLQFDGSPTLKCDLPHRLHYLEPQCFILTELLTDCLELFPSCHISTQVGRKVTLLDLIDDELVGTSFDKVNLLSPAQRQLYGHLEDVILSFLNHTLSQSGVNRKRRDTNEVHLHPIIKRAWRNYSSEVMQLFVSYLRGIGSNLTERHLPLCEQRVEGDEKTGLRWDYVPPAHSTGHYDHLGQWFQQQREESEVPSLPLARSVFAALSHPHDQFLSIHELTMTVKDGLFVSERILPSRDYPSHVHIRIEKVYHSQSFKNIKEKYNDVDVETACETFSKGIRCVRAFLQKILGTHSESMSRHLSGKARVLFQTINCVITKFERSLSVARGLGERLIGRVVQIRSKSMRLDPLTDTLSGETLRSTGLVFPRDRHYDLGDLVCYYAFRAAGQCSYQYPEKIEPKVVRQTQRVGVIVAASKGVMGRGAVEDSVSQKIFHYYSYQLSPEAARAFVGSRVKFTTIFVADPLYREIVDTIAIIH
jgi:hypothetical protein